MFTKTFQTQLNKFSKWTVQNNVKVNFENTIFTFDSFINEKVKDFTEPKKFKFSALFSYIYKLGAYFVKNDEKITDYSFLLDEYQDPIKIKKVSSNTIENFKVDFTLDTESIEFQICECLPYYTDTLITVLGNPEKTGKEQDIHIYEWKIILKNNIISIFDWKEDNTDDLENREKNWYISYNKNSINDLKYLFESLDKETSGIEEENESKSNEYVNDSDLEDDNVNELYNIMDKIKDIEVA